MEGLIFRMLRYFTVLFWNVLIKEGLEGYFRDSGFDQNTVRESGKR